MPEDNFANLYKESPANFEIKTDRGNEGFEKAEFAKSGAKITLGKWNDEVLLSIDYKKINGGGSRKPLTNKIEWQGVDEKAVAFPLEATEQMENGGFEFEIELSKKPASNKFDFEINGAEDLDFFYQPELTQKEKDEGDIRPDNIISSYAVYHKTKKNHATGKTNYKTGKAFHIYRPKAIDANNDEVWGELDYKNGILSVTIPQTFLDNAVYPVIIDPTFGFTGIGGSNITNNGYVSGSLFTGAAGTVQRIDAYPIGGNTSVAKFGIYEHAGLTLIANGESNSWTGTQNWSYATFPTDPTITAQDYVLVSDAAQNGPSTPYFYFDTGATDQGHRETSFSVFTGTLPATFPTYTHSTKKYSIYATYTEPVVAVGRSFGQIL